MIVSTLLEILGWLSAVDGRLGIRRLQFQPFLRFWPGVKAFLLTGRPGTGFQPFLRFWLVDQGRDFRFALVDVSTLLEILEHYRLRKKRHG